MRNSSRHIDTEKASDNVLATIALAHGDRHRLEGLGIGGFPQIAFE